MRRVHFIYIPGLGRGFDVLRRAALITWRLRPGVTAELVSMRWGDDESLGQKIARVRGCIESVSETHEVIVVGESAGGAIALAFAGNNTINRVVTICGKNRRPETIGRRFIERYPAFFHAVKQSEEIIRNLSAEQKARLYVLYSTNDQTIDPEDTRISGVHETRMTTKGHFRSIATALLFRFKAIRGQDVT